MELEEGTETITHITLKVDNISSEDRRDSNNKVTTTRTKTETNRTITTTIGTRASLVRRFETKIMIGIIITTIMVVVVENNMFTKTMPRI